jgi:hypothetical protein
MEVKSSWPSLRLWCNCHEAQLDRTAHGLLIQPDTTIATTALVMAALPAGVTMTTGEEEQEAMTVVSDTAVVMMAVVVVVVADGAGRMGVARSGLRPGVTEALTAETAIATRVGLQTGEMMSPDAAGLTALAAATAAEGAAATTTGTGKSEGAILGGAEEAEGEGDTEVAIAEAGTGGEGCVA